MTVALRIKVCGLTREADVALAVELKAWALGFIFYEKSPRFVKPEVVRQIFDSLKLDGAEPLRVGVFVNSSLSFLEETARTCNLNAIQLHGEEDLEFCRAVRTKFPQLKIFKAVKPAKSDDIIALRGFQFCDALLVDSHSTEARGGTGTLARWDLAKEMAAIDAELPPLILAGGLSEENISRALEEVKPWAVDVSSSLETAPGVKSPEKMKSLFERGRR